MKIKKLLKKYPQSVQYVTWTFAGFAFFLAFYICSRHLFPAAIVYLNGLANLGLAMILFGGFLHYKKMKFEKAFPVVCSCILLSYSFVITIPSLLDRSLSLYLLSSIAQAGERGVKKSQMQNIFVRGYVQGTSSVEKRVNEQEVLGHVTERNNAYVLTPKGHWVYKTNLVLAKVFNISGDCVRGVSSVPAAGSKKSEGKSEKKD